jgi:hypothetical protein
MVAGAPKGVVVFWGLFSALIAAPSLFALIAWPFFKYPHRMARPFPLRHLERHADDL